MKKSIVFISLLMISLSLFAGLGVSYNDVMQGLTDYYDMELRDYKGTNLYFSQCYFSSLEIIGNNKNNIDSTTYSFSFTESEDHNVFYLSVLKEWLSNATPNYYGGLEDIVNKIIEVASTGQEKYTFRRGRYTIKISYIATQEGMVFFIMIN